MEGRMADQRIFINFHNNSDDTSMRDPPQELYPDPPPTYEAYNKASDRVLLGTNRRQPIQDQPRTIRILSVSQPSGTCSGMPELLLISSIVMSIVCLFIFPCVLICTIPGIVVSIMAKDAFRRGKIKRGKCQVWIGGALDVAAFVIAVAFIAILLALEFTRHALEDHNH